MTRRTKPFTSMEGLAEFIAEQPPGEEQAMWNDYHDTCLSLRAEFDRPVEQTAAGSELMQ